MLNRIILIDLRNVGLMNRSRMCILKRIWSIFLGICIVHRYRLFTYDNAYILIVYPCSKGIKEVQNIRTLSKGFQRQIR
jgi:hypothetical protein